MTTTKSLTATCFIIVYQKRKRVKISCRDSILQAILMKLPTSMACWMKVKILNHTRFHITQESSIKKRHIPPGKTSTSQKMNQIYLLSISTELSLAFVAMNIKRTDFQQLSKIIELMVLISCPII